MWQDLQDELADQGFTIITVALDKTPEDAREYIERRPPTYPSLIDTKHVVAELYGIINVPTCVWIDERGRVVRPPRLENASNVWKELTGHDCEPHLQALRRWVTTGELDMDGEEVRRGFIPATIEEQTARAEFRLAQWLYEHGKHEAAKAHFTRAAELAPHDWTIWRGSMRMRDKDPMGEEFFGVFMKWLEDGKPDYVSISNERRAKGC